jgi:hypothetical protein
VLPPQGPVVILGYMKQFRKHLSVAPDGGLVLLGRRRVAAAVNDRFVLNIMHQFKHAVDLRQFSGFNVGFVAGADKVLLSKGGRGQALCHASPDKSAHRRVAVMCQASRPFCNDELPICTGCSVIAHNPVRCQPLMQSSIPYHTTRMQGVAYTLYNDFFSPEGCDAAARCFPVMAPRINFSHVATRDGLVAEVQSWLQRTARPVVIKPQGTGCGHGIEFFFGAEPREEVEAKVCPVLENCGAKWRIA